MGKGESCVVAQFCGLVAHSAQNGGQLGAGCASAGRTERAKKWPRTHIRVSRTLLEGAAGGKCAVGQFCGLTGGQKEWPLGFTPCYRVSVEVQEGGMKLQYP